MPPFAAFHNITAADHQARFDELVPQGYRPISLNVSGDPSDTRYASVWVQRPGPSFVAMHQVSAAQYQAKLDENSEGSGGLVTSSATVARPSIPTQ